jgi:O-antigen/teichoic acid export membrane protein
MGVIERQGVKSSFVQYIAVIIGALSALFIYPKDYAAYGLAQTCLDFVIFITPLATFGATHLVVRFFPYFRSSGKSDNGFLGVLLLIIAGILLLSGSIAYFLGGYGAQALEWLGFDLSLFAKYRYPLTAFVVVYALTMVFDNYASNYNRIAIQSLFTSIIPKIGLPVLVLLLYFQHIDRAEFVWGILGVYAVGLLGLIVYAWRVTAFDFKINFKILQPPLRKEMAIYATYTTFGAMGSILATQMDSLMISTLINIESTGVYKVIAFMVIVIEIPARSIRAIASPIIAESWKKQELKEISHIYNRSSAVLGFVGTALFTLIAINIRDIINWTPNPDEILANLSVFYILGVVRLIDLYTGVNSQLITFSDYFRFNMVAILILAVLNLTFNYFFIVNLEWGLVGVATSTLISIFLYNLTKYLFILFKMKMQPFSKETLKILVVGGIAFSLNWIPIETGISFVNVAIRSLLAISPFFVALRYWKVCPEIYSALNKYLSKIIGVLRD